METPPYATEDLPADPTSPATEAEQPGTTAPQAPASAEGAQAEAAEATPTPPSNAELGLAEPGLAIPPAWQARLIEEHRELTQRLLALNAFLLSPQVHDLHPVDNHLLREQRRAMQVYAQVLETRLGRL